MGIEKMIAYGMGRVGKVTYSMTNRLSETSMDCSSFVFKSLIQGGFLAKGSFIGNTETLFSLNGKLFKEIAFSQVKRGDIFISGTQGASNGSAGHTGIHLGDGKIIHCTYGYKNNNVAITNAVGWMGDYSGLTVRHFRIISTDVPNTSGKPQQQLLILDGMWGGSTTTRLQEFFGLTIRDGFISHQYKQNYNQNIYSAQFDDTLIGSNLILQMQRKLKKAGFYTGGIDGLCGKETIIGLQKAFGTTQDGIISNKSDMVRAMQQGLNLGELPF